MRATRRKFLQGLAAIASAIGFGTRSPILEVPAVVSASVRPTLGDVIGTALSDSVLQPDGTYLVDVLLHITPPLPGERRYQSNMIARGGPILAGQMVGYVGGGTIGQYGVFFNNHKDA